MVRMWRNLVICLGLVYALTGCSQDDNSTAMRAQREAHTSMEWAIRATEQAEKAEFWGRQSSDFYSRIVEEYRLEQAARMACQQTCPKTAAPKVPVPKVVTDSTKGQIIIQYQTTTTTTQPPRPCCSGSFYRDSLGREFYFAGSVWRR